MVKIEVVLLHKRQLKTQQYLIALCVSGNCDTLRFTLHRIQLQNQDIEMAINEIKQTQRQCEFIESSFSDLRKKWKIVAAKEYELSMKSKDVNARQHQLSRQEMNLDSAV